MSPQVTGLRAVNVSLEGLLVKETADEEQLLAVLSERREHLAELHRLAFAFSPPFLAVKAVAREEDGQADRCFTRDRGTLHRVAPNVERLQPRQRHRDANSAKHGATGELVFAHSDSPEL